MEIKQVKTKQDLDKFHQLPYRIYQKYKNWVPPLRMQIENIFNPERSKNFQHGNACRWIAEDHGKCVGRIAAFYNLKTSEGNDQLTGGIGFFECIDDESVARLLFNTSRDWLKNAGMDAMDGPVNFGINFFNWGLLISGDYSQTYGMQYNPAYYRKLFESYGFNVYYEQYSYRMDITYPDLPDRFWKIAAWVAQKPDFSFVHFTFKNQEKYVRDFLEIHRMAWNKHGNYIPIDPDEINKMLKESKMVLDEEFIWFVYHKENPIAFFMMIPDLNQILVKIKNGKMNLLNLLKLIYYQKARVINRSRVIVLGVIPQFQRSGIESGIFHHLKGVLLKKKWYKEMEMSWVGDFNPKMNTLFKSMGARHVITHCTMRYLFDREKEFRRLPVIKD